MITQLFTHYAASCAGGSFLGFPKWYKYLDGQEVTSTVGPAGAKVCTPMIGGLTDIWLIVAAVIEMLLRIGALFAIAIVVYGSIQFITSQGEPSKTQAARSTIINALIGLVITISAATAVSFIAGSFK